MTDWAAITGAVGGVIGAIAGVGGAAVAMAARRDSRTSADAAEDSAEAARRSADADTAVAAIERDRQHRELTPQAPPTIEAFHKGNSLFGSITVPRDYRVAADGIYRAGGSQKLALPLLLRANQQQEFQIELWPDGVQAPRSADVRKPTTKEIRFRFWPPIESDDAPPWDCPCGQPTGETWTARVTGNGRCRSYTTVHAIGSSGCDLQAAHADRSAFSVDLSLVTIVNDQGDELPIVDGVD